VDILQPSAPATALKLNDASGHCLTAAGPHGFLHSITLEPGAYVAKGRAVGAGTLRVLVTGVRAP
jgi:hypothetical protein